MKASFCFASMPIAEVQGPYGPLRLLETQVQRCWAMQQLGRGDWRLRDGRTLAVRHPGSWNAGAGPDFRDAVLEIGGCLVPGDVELHLYREDWWRHGHHMDPAYNRVVAHVVLFAGGMGNAVRTEDGREVPEWVMGPWLREDLEAVSGGEPGLFGERTPELSEWIAAEALEVVRERLAAGCDRRWGNKEAMAHGLLREFGFEGALHRLVLYYLGFPLNRKAFLAIAGENGPETWRARELLPSIRHRWGNAIQWRHGRPGNRPARLLGAYQELFHRRPDWMARLAEPPYPLCRALAAAEGDVLATDSGAFRRRFAHAGLFRWLRTEVTVQALGDGLLRRLWIDAFLPLLAARGVLPTGASALHFFHSRPGACPEALLAMCRRAGLCGDGNGPSRNGWIQGLLWVEDQMRSERLRRCSGHGAGGGA